MFYNHGHRVLVLSGGGSFLVTPKKGACPGKFLKLRALKLHFQHSENTFGEIFYIFKTIFYWCILW